jgi:hypothetical protein
MQLNSDATVEAAAGSTSLAMHEIRVLVECITRHCKTSKHQDQFSIFSFFVV